jgi:hypothetical protein
MKSIFIFIVFLLILNNKILSQTISGRVLDAKTLSTAPYSTLEIKGKGIGWVTDSIGNFILEIPKDIISENDTLLIRSLGFSSTEVLLKSVLNNTSIEIKLRPSIFQLDTIIIKPKANSFIKGVTVEKAKANSGSSEWGQVAVYMDNEDEVKGIIQNVSFFISSRGKPKAPFRIRFYERQDDGSPGRDLIQENIIATPQKGNMWFKVDVSKYKIIVPKEGYFVAMEWIFTDKRIFDEKIVPNTWMYNLGNKWVKDDEPFKFQGKITFFNDLINSEIKPIE